MNRSMLIIMGSALAIAMIVGLFVSSRLTPKSEGTSVPSTEILVANKVILTGQKLKPEDTRWQAFPNDSLYPGVIKKSDYPNPDKMEYYDSPLRHDLESGEPVTTRALITDAKSNFLSALIAPGMRAVAVNVSQTSTAGGFVAPGDHVDVLLAYTMRLNGPAQNASSDVVQRFATEIVLSDVKVLAVDQNSNDSNHEAKVGRTATLEVSLKDAEKLAIAEQMGTLSLVMRRIGEKDAPNGPPPPIETDVTSTPLIKKLIDRADTPQGQVRVYSGNTVQNVPVRQD